jgi:SAM-dependent methyltransferase
MLSTSLFGESLTLDAFPHAPEISGLGMSDWEGYALPLEQRLGYRNTFLDKDPVLDIAKPLPPNLIGSFDFVISSEVLEHVAPPWQRALARIRELLVPGGLLVMTVPTMIDFSGTTREHFPELYEYDILEFGGTPILVNRAREGYLQVFDDLIFHGGGGATLEMREFSTSDLLDQLMSLGFTARTWSDPVEKYGIIWHEQWSLPLVAVAPGS